MNTFTYVYELLKMKPEENIQNMKKQFIHIVNNLNYGQYFLNEDLINKSLDA